MIFSEEHMMKRVQETLAFLDNYLTVPIDVAIVAGSGLGKFADVLTDTVEVSYDTIPHFIASTVVGHAGKLIFGYVGTKRVVLMAGRTHYYEGHSMQEITYPIRVFQMLNIPHLVLTNAAGGMHDVFSEGAIMLIQDHINLMGDSPLVGQNMAHFGERFPAMNTAYPASERAKVKAIAENLAIKVHEGVYAAWKGPAYETPAEIRYIKMIGADAVGMSTVPEVLVAVHGGMKVLALSCITNMAAGLAKESPNHQEVMEMADRLSQDICTLVQTYIETL